MILRKLAKYFPTRDELALLINCAKDIDIGERVYKIPYNVIDTLTDVMQNPKDFPQGALKAVVGRVINATVLWPVSTKLADLGRLLYALRKPLQVVQTEHMASIKSKCLSLAKHRKEASLVYILYGEPGVGKTYIAHSLAAQLSHQGFILVEQPADSVLQTERRPSTASPDDARLREEVGAGREIVLVDEFDRGLEEADLGRLLRWIDTERRKPGIRVIFLTTNKTPEQLDIALLRKGRVTDCIEITPWTEKEAKDFCVLKEVPFSVVKNDTGNYYPGTLLEQTQEYWINQIERNER